MFYSKKYSSVYFHIQKTKMKNIYFPKSGLASQTFFRKGEWKKIIDAIENEDAILSDKDYTNRLVETHFLLKDDLTARATWRYRNAYKLTFRVSGRNGKRKNLSVRILRLRREDSHTLGT